MQLVRPAPLPNVPVGELPWEGEISPKPWQYDVTVVIPNLNSKELLDVALNLWRFQTLRPYIVIIDTGSECEEVYDLFKIRTHDLEVHLVRANAWRHPSEPVTAAMDLAFSMANTPYLLATHADLFPRSRTLVEDLVRIMKTGYDVVGWQMSERTHGNWYDFPSHTCSLYYVPTMDRIRACWSLRRYTRTAGIASPLQGQSVGGWPDTESMMGSLIKSRKLRWKNMGPEKNGQRQLNEYWDHIRSYPSSKLYCKEYHEQAKGWAIQAIQQAAERAESWEKEARNAGQTHKIA